MLNRLTLRFAVALFVWAACGAAASAQSRKKPSAKPPSSILRVRSNLVVVPALVTTKSGRIVFSLTTDDFLLTDNGVPQALKLERNTDSEPLALAVVVETSGGGPHLRDYRALGPVLAAVVGGVHHRVAVIAFGGSPRLVLDFTPNTNKAARAIADLRSWGTGASILDALNFAIDFLHRQPSYYRRAVLLLSGTVDTGSQASLASVLSKIDNTDTEIYAVSFSSINATVAHQMAEDRQPYGPGGCMSKSSARDAHEKRSVQALNCLSDLLPPLQWARWAFLAAHDAAKRNVPKTVAQLTGGEYFRFKNPNTLTRDLLSISNDIPNYYVLTFRPHSPAPGFHAIKLSVKDRPGLRVRAPRTYWVEPETTAEQN
jgi:VWFA-related protein